MNDSGFNSGAEMNIDNIFFYEDNSNTQSSQDSLPIVYNNNNENNNNAINTKSDDQAVSMDTNDQADTLFQNAVNIPKQKRAKDSSYKQIQVSVGIDEDLKMILDMDPTLIDGSDLEKAVEPAVHDDARLTALPPKM